MRMSMTELWERYHHRLVVCAFLFSIKSLLGAAVFVFPDAAAGLQLAAWIFGVMTWLAFFVLSMIFMVQQTKLFLSLTGPADLRRRGRLHEDGFTFHVLKTATCVSWVVTVATLWILDVIVDAVLPSALFIKLALFVCLSTFSVVYFVLNLTLPGKEARHEAT